jgi:hypothetical protein
MDRIAAERGLFKSDFIDDLHEKRRLLLLLLDVRRSLIRICVCFCACAIRAVLLNVCTVLLSISRNSTAAGRSNLSDFLICLSLVLCTRGPARVTRMQILEHAVCFDEMNSFMLANEERQAQFQLPSLLMDQDF